MSILSRLRLADGPARPDTSEQGSNAVSWASPSGGSPRLYDPEYKYELRGRQGSKLYQRMRWSDPHIAGLRDAQNLPLLRAAAKIEAAEYDDPDAEAKKELVERLLLHDFPWRGFLQDTLLAIDYGFAPFEIVWRLEDGETRFRLALRPPDSIAVEDIHVKDGAIDHVLQRPITGGEYTIPGEKLVWFAHHKEGDQFNGRPILRAMYKPWRIKEELEQDLPELIRKLGGIPDITTQGEPDTATAAALDAMAAAFGMAPGAFMRHDDTVAVNLLTGNASVSDVLAAIKQRNTEITSVCQAQVFDLGTSNSGSRALGTTLSDLFSQGIQAQASYREDVLNARGGLIHQCIAYNFGTDDNLPKLRFGNVSPADMRAFAAAMLAFSQAFGTLPEETQEWAFEEMNMPAGKTAQVVVEPAAVTPSAPQPTAGDGQPLEDGAQASEAHTHAHAGLRLAELRPLRGCEVYLDLAELTSRFDDAKTAVKDATQATREALARELVRHAAAAQASGKLDQFAAGAPPMIDALSADIERVLGDFYAAGRSQVATELQRQREGIPWSADAVGLRVAAAEDSQPGILARLREQARAVARAIAAQVQAAAAHVAARIGAGVPVDREAMLTAVARESDAAVLRMAGTVTDVMQLGRADEARAQASDVEDGVYSALLDGAVCDVCQPMDGEVTTDIDLAASWTPNPGCLGGGRCRCLVVYEISQGGTP